MKIKKRYGFADIIVNADSFQLEKLLRKKLFRSGPGSYSRPVSAGFNLPGYLLRIVAVGITKDRDMIYVHFPKHV